MNLNWLKKILSVRPGKARNRRRRSVAGLERLEQRQVLTMLMPVSVNPGVNVSTVEIRDFNGDSINDLAELNSSLGQVSVQLGNGDGTFGASVTSSAGGTGTKMSVADFNHDGKLDLVTSQGYTIDLLKGNGDGSFQPPVPYSVGPYANDIEVGDFNHDGFDDVVTASFSYGGTTEIFINDGMGSFLPGHNMSIGPNGLDIEVGDIDGDGDEDLIQSGGNGVVGVLVSRGDGTFYSVAWVNVGYTVQDIHVEDMNHDGRDDVVTSDGSTIRYYAGNGEATFQNALSYPSQGSSRFQIGDVNGDGHRDILTNGGAAVLGRGTGEFYASSQYGHGSSSGIGLGDLNGDSVPDAVLIRPSTSGGGVDASFNGNNDRQLLAGATHVAISASPSTTAGVAVAVTVTALDDNGNVVTGFLGTVAVSGAVGTDAISYTFTAADNGVHTILDAAVFYKAGQDTIHVTSPFLPDSSGSITVQGGAAAKFQVTGQPSSIAGELTSVTVTTYDLYDNFAAEYLGTVRFGSSDLQAELPADYTFTAADAGSHTFSLRLKTAGNQTVQAYDVSNSGFSGASGNVSVTPAAAASLTLTGGSGYIGSVNAVRITAKDAFGNAATGYNGIVHLSSSDPNSITSADAALTNGVGTFTVQPMTLGQQTLTAVDTTTGSIIGSEVIDVTPGWGVRLGMTALPSTTGAGQTQTTQLSIYDSFGNISTVFTGWVVVRSSDPRVTPAYHYFSAGDAGVKTIPVTLYTAGIQSVTVSDNANPGTTFTQTGIVVTSAAARSIAVTPLHGTTAGTSQDFTVSARDTWGNIATGYAGTLHFVSSDATATLPADYTFTATDGGVHTFSIVYRNASGQDISITDTQTSTISYYQRDIYITPDVLNHFAVRSPSSSNVVAGTTLDLEVTANDVYGNTITDYAGTINVSSTDAQATFPSSYTFDPSEGGIHLFSGMLKSAGDHSVTFTDSADARVTGGVSGITVNAAATARFRIQTSLNATAGLSQTVVISATDEFGNATDSYTGAVSFSSSDAAATLPSGLVFGNRDKGTASFNATFRTSGVQSLTVTDAVNGFSSTLPNIVVTPSQARVTSFAVTGMSAATAGTAGNITIVARDASGNIVSGFRGTVSFSSTDSTAALPASYTFTEADGGTHSFSATLFTAGIQSISVKNVSDTTVTGTLSGITIKAAAAARFVISAPTSATQGSSIKFTVTVQDNFGNIVTDYAGKVRISSTDSKAGTTDYTFAKKDAGVHTFSYTFSTLGRQTLLVTDLNNVNVKSQFTLDVFSKK